MILIIAILIFSCNDQLSAQNFNNCSIISLTSGDTVVMGRNHDGNLANCLVVFNPRGLVKEGFEFPGENTPKWTSEYASITFNVLGVGFAVLGMNEEGLSIGHMGFSEAKYPAKDDRMVLDQIQFITYILDNCANTAEVIEKLDEIRISDESYTREHYFACDKTGKFAVIEFINGELVLNTNETMPYPLVSNDNYDKSIAYLKNYAGFGGEKPIPERTFGVEEIMAIGCTRLNEYQKRKNGDIVESAFSILHDIGFNKFPPPDTVDVHPNYGTQFTVIFDLKNLETFFKTKSNSYVRKIDFDFFNSSCASGTKMLEIENTTAGNVNSLFADYSLERNLSYLIKWNNSSRTLSKDLIDFLSQYPESFKCE